jgi:hypothetical protein
MGCHGCHRYQSIAISEMGCHGCHLLFPLAHISCLQRILAVTTSSLFFYLQKGFFAPPHFATTYHYLACGPGRITSGIMEGPENDAQRTLRG